MSTIVTRSGKGSPLTNAEVDSNFENLNTDKAELSGAVFTGAITTNSTIDGRDVAADGVTADAALPKSGGAMTGAITTNSTFDGVDIATRDAVLTSTTTTANAALPKAGGAMTGAITTNSTFDGRDVATDGTKLDGIEASATADQTGAQIKTAYEAETNAFTDAQFTKLGGIEASATADQTAAEIRALVECATDSNVFTDADHTKLNGVEASADVTANAGALMDSELTSIASVKALNQGVATGDSPTFAALTSTGEITANGGIALGDNDKATFGASDDLQIYHDGTHSRIVDAGTGNLSLQGNDLRIKNSDASATYIQAANGGAVELAHNNNIKIATTSTGIDVTGTATMDGLTASTSGNQVMLLDSVNGATTIQMRTGSGSISNFIRSGIGSSANLRFETTGNVVRQKIDANGDISFYEDTGTTPKFFWDASAERLGIGVVPSKKLEIAGYNQALAENNTLRFTDTDTASQTNQLFGKIEFNSLDSDAASPNRAYILSAAENSLTPSYIAFGTAPHSSAATERARISSEGHLLVGTSNNSQSVGIGTKIKEWGSVMVVNNSSTGGGDAFSYFSSASNNYKFWVNYNGQIASIYTSIQSLSDQRFKENIRDLDDGLSKVMQLQPRKFDWKEGKGKNITNDRGFIAQEFEEVFPDLIGEWKEEAPEGEEPYKSLSQDLIPTLVKAIQEQQTLIESLTTRIAALEE